MKKFEKPSINVDIFSVENVVTTSGSPERLSAYDASMANLASKDIMSQEVNVFGFEEELQR